jgi:uncharacterized membrane protein
MIEDRKHWRFASMNRHALFFVAALALTTAALALRPSPAQASFRVCNDHNEKISSAVAYYSADYGYAISEGWWSLTPGECKTALSGDLKVKYIYVYAENNDNSWAWSGDFKVCVNPTDPFTLYDAQNKCPFEFKDFRQVDTGEYKSYTYTFK